MATDGMLSDEIMRKKLLIDGEGIGDDRRLTLLMKTFLKWSNSETDSENETMQTYERMLLMLDQCEAAMVKSSNVQRNHQIELQNLDSLYKSIENSLTQANEKIVKYKNELQTAKRIRKNKQEYNTLAKVILSEPDREKTLNQLQDIDRTLEKLGNVKKNLETKIEERRKQSHVLVNAINQLLYYVEEDENELEKGNFPDEQNKMDTD